jgi:phosphate transport system permease protein
MISSRISPTFRSTTRQVLNPRNVDDIVRSVLWIAAAAASVIVCAVVVVVLREAAPAIGAVGLWRFVTDPSWHPAHGSFNLAPMIVGTFLVAGGAVVLGTVLSLASAIFCCFYAPGWAARVYAGVMELIAGIPSVVLGLWGLTVLVPLIAHLKPPGASVLAAVLILALMVLPTITLLAIVALRSVPQTLLLGAQALGMSRWSVITKIAVPAARRGLISGIVLGASRALGETMAVLMVSGNIVQVPHGLFEPVRTLAANIVLEIPYAEGVHRSSLFVSGFFLILIIFGMLCIAEWFAPEAPVEI